MCMEHEDEYEGCADHLYIDNYVIPRSITTIIEETLGAKFTDRARVVLDITSMLDTWHVAGLMVPDADRRRTDRNIIIK